MQTNPDSVSLHPGYTLDVGQNKALSKDYTLDVGQNKALSKDLARWFDRLTMNGVLGISLS
jgi:hypothetical protein